MVDFSYIELSGILKMKMQQFLSRRQKLADSLTNNSICLLASSPEQLRNPDIHYPYRQDSNIFYLSGFIEPNVVLVISKQNNSTHTIIFNQTNNPSRSLWTGGVLGQKEAISQLGVDQAFPIDDLNKHLPSLLDNIQNIYTQENIPAWFKHKLNTAMKRVHGSSKQAKQKNRIQTIDPILAELRLIKSPEEITYLKKAASISAAAHITLMQKCKPSMHEYELEALLMQHFYQHNCKQLAYPSIIAGGKNACTLHYIENKSKLASGDLVLVDAGTEYNYYASDITRTFPTNGRFTDTQKAVYEIVLNTQQQLIDMIKPGVSWQTLQDASIYQLTAGCIDLGLLSGSIANNIEKKTYLRYYYHGFGHWLGLDVHDVGDYHTKDQRKERKLKAGMTMTVEPGLYISNNHDINSRWHNIGIRIEDDILVTQHGCEVLSKDAPKNINEIEKLMQT